MCQIMAAGKRKRGMQFIPYDYEDAYNKAMEDMHEWFVEQMFQHRKKVIYALIFLLFFKTILYFMGVKITKKDRKNSVF